MLLIGCSIQIATAADDYQFVTKWGTRRTVSFNNPEGIAVDTAGNVYVADTGNSLILKYTSTGTFVTMWGAPCQGIAVDSASNVYVTDLANNRVRKYTSTGTFVTAWGTHTATGEDGKFYYPQGIAVDAAGYVYVTDGSDRVQKFTSTGTFVMKWDRYTSGDGQFYPAGVAVDSAGNVYVTEDTFYHRLQKFTSTGTFVTTWGTEGTGNGEFDTPDGIAVDSAGNVYVADTKNDRVQKFTSTGTFVTKWGTEGAGDGQFSIPDDIAIDSAGHVYVADYGNDRVQIFDATGAFLAKWSKLGTGSSRFPWYIAVDANGNYVYIADWNHNRVQKYTSTGTFVTEWGTYGSGDGQLSYPTGIAVDGPGNVYVAEFGNGRVQKFTPTGTFITKWGLFKHLGGIAVDTAGNVYVTDSEDNYVQMFTSTGTFVTTFGTYGSGNGQLSYPSGIAVDGAGNVYVADTQNHRVQKFSSGTTDTTPPASVTNLRDTDRTADSITWTWTDPPDSDFNKVRIYKNGATVGYVDKGVQSYTMTGLSPNTYYTIGTRTYDSTGNANASMVKDPGKTASYDTTPPTSVSNLKDIARTATSITWTWTDPPDPDFTKVRIYKNGATVGYVDKGVQSYTMTGLTPNTYYTIGTRTYDSTGNANASMVKDPGKTATGDTTPPASVTNLRVISTMPVSITWAWTDPTDTDFAKVRVYKNGATIGYVNKGVQTYTMTGLSPSTWYTLYTLTYDTAGNSNATTVKKPGKTAASSTLSESVTREQVDLNASSIECTAPTVLELGETGTGQIGSDGNSTDQAPTYVRPGPHTRTRL